MGVFYCSSCNKPIKTVLHRCGFEDKLTCKLYDPGKNACSNRRSQILGGRSEEDLPEDESDLFAMSDGLSGIPGENGYYPRGILL